MKNSRSKIVAALAMLVISVVALTSSAYAWFSMNTTVTATDMQITANTTNTYLIIGSAEDALETNDDLAEIQGLNASTVAMTSTANVFPSKPCSTDDAATVNAADTANGGTDVTNAVAVTTQATAAVATNWFKATAAAVTATTAKDNSQLQLDTFAGYVLKKTVLITVATGSNTATNLKVNAAFTKSGAQESMDPVRVLVAGPNGIADFSADATNDITNTAAAAVALSSTVTSAATVSIDIYVYYDGSHADVFTNNAANLAGATIDLTFTVA